MVLTRRVTQTHELGNLRSRHTLRAYFFQFCPSRPSSSGSPINKWHIYPHILGLEYVHSMSHVCQSCTCHEPDVKLIERRTQNAANYTPLVEALTKKSFKTKCVLIPKSLDGRIQGHVSFNQLITLQHSLYGKITGQTNIPDITGNLQRLKN